MTKFYNPLPRSNLIGRPQLIERLKAGLHYPLTLIAAGAGFGKTTLLSNFKLQNGLAVPGRRR